MGKMSNWNRKVQLVKMSNWFQFKMLIWKIPIGKLQYLLVPIGLCQYPMGKISNWFQLKYSIGNELEILVRALAARL